MDITYNRIKDKGIATTYIEIPSNPQYSHINLDSYFHDRIIKAIKTKRSTLNNYAINFISGNPFKYGLKISAFGSSNLNILEQKYNQTYFISFISNYIQDFSNELNSILCSLFINQELSKKQGYSYTNNVQFFLEEPTSDVMLLKELIASKKEQMTLLQKEITFLSVTLYKMTGDLLIQEITNSTYYSPLEKALIIKQLRLPQPE